jgi:hypothetical protein
MSGKPNGRFVPAGKRPRKISKGQIALNWKQVRSEEVLQMCWKRTWSCRLKKMLEPIL